MKFFDISIEVKENMIVWPGDKGFSRLEFLGSAITSRLEMSTHTGTHIDAPKHFLFKKGSVDQIALSKLIGPAEVIDFTSLRDNLIEVRDLQKLRFTPGARILFKTRNSKIVTAKKFTADYVSLSLEAAKHLAKKKISLVGTDYYGIEAKSAPGHPVHKALLAAGVVILEGLNLSKVPRGRYNLAALPLRLIGGDGSPARAVLWK